MSPIRLARLMRTVKPRVREKILRSNVAGGLSPGEIPCEKIRSRMPPGKRYAMSSPKAEPMMAPRMMITTKAAVPPGFFARVLPSSHHWRFPFSGRLDAVMKAKQMQGGNWNYGDAGPRCLTRASAREGMVNAAGMTCVASP